MRVNSSPFQWICTRCAVAKGIPVKSVLGIRTRFGHEKCPLCTNPGAGMEYVKVPQDANDTQGVQ